MNKFIIHHCNVSLHKSKLMVLVTVERSNPSHILSVTYYAYFLRKN